ncbi:nitrite reductase small subunit NirD [Plantactinospora sp. GCM10030261]|uniref:nitrite reductase small subunit NirD n=1 Tax=Plantactinospora sp. GCM10030261 TaxID=3273420 RepID=UPI00360A3174
MTVVGRAARPPGRPQADWTAVCRLADLLPERGVAALLDGVQVAVFRLHDDGVRAIGNRDPLCGAYVLSRGVVGTRGERPVVASPMHKQAYDLDTGRCLDVPDVTVPVYRARVRDGLVEVALR